MTDPLSHGGGIAPSAGINVLVNQTLEDDFCRSIAAVDPRVHVMRVYEPWVNNADTREEMTMLRVNGPRVVGAEPHDEVVWQRAADADIDLMLAKANVLFGFNFPVEWVDRAPELRWVQLASAGSDHMFRAGLFTRKPGLLVTTASGVHEVPISEHVVGMVLHFSRGFDLAVRNQAAHKWDRYRPLEAYGQTVCLVGYGPIARRAAALFKALGMRSIAVRASITEPAAGAEGEPVERFYPAPMLEEALAQADYVVIAAPRTAQSEHMIGAKQLAAMKRDAVLVNISRGALVDEAALVEALRDGTIRGAGLDVFEEEPLPENSPLWDMPNVLITPHISGVNPHYNRRVTELFRDNLARFLKGEPLRNLVIEERGY
ncbi:MAG TPA: D-2-hydroxyacid dehydrogenase [Chloroflexia bacterium]|nr:D-2-hydroxyacid dehydrogenase [Chloroflexia bacterium]